MYTGVCLACMCTYVHVHKSVYVLPLHVYYIGGSESRRERKSDKERGGGGDEGMIRGQESTIVHVHCTSIVLRFSNTFSLARFVACQQQVVLCT